VARRAHDTVKEAECYQQIALIYERQDEMQSAIEYLNRFLEICIENKNQD
jgi:regulator of sirC expression with transglutaminase-like and TPR domain